MWSTNHSVFRTITCPRGSDCKLFNCPFQHGSVQGSELSETSTTPNPLTTFESRETFKSGEPSAFVGSLVSKSSAQATRISSKPGPPRQEELNSTDDSTSNDPRSQNPQRNARTSERDRAKSSLSKPISPPLVARKAISTAPTEKVPMTPKKAEGLVPRKVRRDPVPFGRRMVLLKNVHKSMASLNDEASNNPAFKKLHLAENELVQLALDQEEKTATNSAGVYENLMKQRIVALRKMKLDAWIAERRAALPPPNAEGNGKPHPDPVHTGLSWNEEKVVLRRLVASTPVLKAHDYVTTVFTDEELRTTLQGIEHSSNWEECDRCGTRFQVFPDRREEDGALTSGGKCKYHWGRKGFTKKTKTEAGPQQRWTCCNDVIGTEGCVTNDTHVFKVMDKRRLWTIMPYIETPENAKADPTLAVCFDCEMGYTTLGLELMRLTAISWPEHKPLIDVLVRPLGTLLDLNTRFSGITPDNFFNAASYESTEVKDDSTKLRIVESPFKARELLLSLISPETPLIGHALDNDLNSIRLIHPNIVDTAIAFPHPRGLPYRNGLRNLTKHYLEWDIQQGGAAGHDSHEDARATGELVRFKVGKEWQKMSLAGWTIRDGALIAPVSSGPKTQVSEPPQSELVRKRKRSDGEDSDGLDMDELPLR